MTKKYSIVAVAENNINKFFQSAELVVFPSVRLPPPSMEIFFSPHIIDTYLFFVSTRYHK